VEWNPDIDAEPVNTLRQGEALSL